MIHCALALQGEASSCGQARLAARGKFSVCAQAISAAAGGNTENSDWSIEPTEISSTATLGMELPPGQHYAFAITGPPEWDLWNGEPVGIDIFFRWSGAALPGGRATTWAIAGFQSGAPRNILNGVVGAYAGAPHNVPLEVWAVDNNTSEDVALIGTVTIVD